MMQQSATLAATRKILFRLEILYISTIFVVIREVDKSQTNNLISFPK